MSIEERKRNMVCEPTDYLMKSRGYGVDLSYRVWDIEAGEIVYQEHGDGEIDLREVLDGTVFWKNSTEMFTFSDFLSECLNL